MKMKIIKIIRNLASKDKETRPLIEEKIRFTLCFLKKPVDVKPGMYMK